MCSETELLGFALHCYVIGQNNSRYFLNQLELSKTTNRTVLMQHKQQTQ